jgi:flagellar L-ring protein precursor FlgH
MTRFSRRTVGPVVFSGLAFVVTGCASLPGVADPQMSPITNPASVTGGRLITMPTPVLEPEIYAPNSLWRAGARSFFNDQRADAVGDILTVNIRIADRARVQNSTTRSRTASQSAGVSGMFGFEDRLGAVLPNGVDPEALIGLDSAGQASGTGQVNRAETIELTVAAVITDQLPNGNFLIAGRQEVRVNSELRELLVSGIVRPEDISADNSVEHTQIAEARISYGGRGDISAVQRPRIGQRVVEAVAPF